MESYFKSECTAVPKTTAAPAAPSSKAEIQGLRQWLKEKGRESQFDQVTAWCDENGAVLLDEVQENWEDIVQELGDAPAKAGNPPSIPGLEAWLEEMDLEEMLWAKKP